MRLVAIRVGARRGVEEALVDLLRLRWVIRGLVSRRAGGLGGLVLARPGVGLVVELVNVPANDRRDPCAVVSKCICRGRVM